MNEKRMDWHLIVGLITNSVVILIRNTIGLSEFISGLGSGFAITMMIYGTIVMAGRNVSGIKKFKRGLIGGNKGAE
jgi:hypothetical protein